MTQTPHIGHHPVRRLKQFLRPDGRRVHVVPSPEVAESLKLQLSQEESDGDYELVIHGSPEHIEAIREMHSHHEGKRDALRKEHTSIYQEFENVHNELDALSAELHALSEHGMALDANFSRYGYSATLRTREPDSSSSSTYSASLEKRDWDAERLQGRPMVFWKRPIVRQYMHKGLIWRASETEDVMSFELFVDLLYVGIIAINGDQAAESPTGAALLQFSITFILSWKLWSELTLIISWFETDDIFQRLSILFIMVCLTGYTTNITNAHGSTYTQLVAFYLTSRLFNASYYLSIAYMLPMVRGTMIAQTIIAIIPASVWMASIHIELPTRLGLIWAAIVCDIFGPGIIPALMLVGQQHESGPLSWFGHYFEFYPAVNIEHKTERTNAFVTLIFGYSVVSLLYQNQAPFGINAFFGKAILGLIQAYAFNWIYFEVDGINLHCHAIRRHRTAFLAWMYLHLPFIMSFVLAAASLSKLVISHDCTDADPNTLADSSRQNSDPEIQAGLRWFYSVGLGISLACMGGISVAHEHKEIQGVRIRKRQRLLVRFCVAIILLFLPLASKLDSLQLIATTTGLVVFVLAVDLYGLSCVQDSFWRDKSTCKYSARCRMRRQDMEAAIKTGAIVNTEEMGGEKGFLDIR